MLPISALDDTHTDWIWSCVYPNGRSDLAYLNIFDSKALPCVAQKHLLKLTRFLSIISKTDNNAILSRLYIPLVQVCLKHLHHLLHRLLTVS